MILDTLHALIRELPTHESLTGLGDAFARSCKDLIEVGGESQVARTSIHLRSTTSYEAVMPRSWLELPEDVLSSATAWQFIQHHRATVTLDVQLRLMYAPGLPDAMRQPLERFDDREEVTGSISHLLNMEATHIVFVPLIDADELIGMIAIECLSPLRIGQEFPDPQTTQALGIVAAMVAPELQRQPPEVPAPQTDELLPVIGKRMSRPIAMLEQFSRQDETILLTGASGTGKSRLARWCHARSARAEGPFEVLNLLAVPGDMQMAELVGWRRGAFTGAVQDVDGAIARAEGGTLFIDELDKISPEAQAGLLMLLEEGTYRRLGDSGGQRVADVRFIVGTNVDVEYALAEGIIREDLFWRINVFPISLPPLSHRTDELEAWAHYMLERAGDTEFVLEPEAIGVLRAQPWPGNLRQLDNIVRRITQIAQLRETTRIGADVVREALSLDGTPAHLDVVVQMRQLAHALVQHAQGLRDGGHHIDLDLLSALQGYALEAALEVTDDEADAFGLFGRERTVSARNHHRVLKRERERVAQFESALTPEDPPSPGD